MRDAAVAETDGSGRAITELERSADGLTADVDRAEAHGQRSGASGDVRREVHVERARDVGCDQVELRVHVRAAGTGGRERDGEDTTRRVGVQRVLQVRSRTVAEVPQPRGRFTAREVGEVLGTSAATVAVTQQRLRAKNKKRKTKE